MMKIKLLFLIILLFPAFLFAEPFGTDEYAPFEGYEPYHDWRQKYVGRESANCCGTEDCVKVGLNMRIIKRGPRFSVVEVYGNVMTVETRSIHTSEDEHNWYCSRILFAHKPKGCDISIFHPDCYQCFFFASRI